MDFMHEWFFDGQGLVSRNGKPTHDDYTIM